MAMNPMEQFAIKPIVPLHIGGYDVSFTNQSLLMVIVAVAASAFLTLAMSKRSLVPSRSQSMAEMSYEFVANMIQTSTGEDGLRFFPFVFTLFIFVLCSNFFGMIPGSFTVTSQIAVTFALASLVILTVIVTGFAKHGIANPRLDADVLLARALRPQDRFNLILFNSEVQTLAPAPLGAESAAVEKAHAEGKVVKVWPKVDPAKHAKWLLAELPKPSPAAST